MQTDYVRVQKVDGGIVQTGSVKSFFGQPETVFAEWDFDGETLLVQNDFHGFQPLFYFERENEICFSPSLLKLLELRSPLDLDEAALAVFLRLGFFVGEDTPFRAIKALPPGARLRWRNGEISLTAKGYSAPSPTQLSSPEIVAAFAELFKKAVEKMLPANDDYAVPLSGGRDSRFILFELMRAGRRPPRECITLQHFPPRANEDEKIALQLCQTLNLRHHVLSQSPSPVEAELQKNLLTHFCADEHGWYLPLANYIEPRFPRIYDGLAGDILTGAVAFEPPVAAAVNQAFCDGDFRTAAENLLEEGYLPNLLRPEALLRFNRTVASERLAAELAKHANAPNPLLSFQFYNRTRRKIALAPFSLFNAKTKIYAPFLDYQLTEFLMSVPFKTSADVKLRDAAINFSFPEFAGIPYEDKNAPKVRDRQFWRNFGFDLLRYADPKKSSRLINKSFWLPRIARSLVDLNYAESINSFGLQIIYLLQMERLIEKLERQR